MLLQSETAGRLVVQSRNPGTLPHMDFRGSHLSNATCLKQVFFQSGEECSKS